VPPTDTRPRPALGRRRFHLPAVLAVALAIAIPIAVVAQLAPGLAGPRHVAALRISNGNPYQVNVEVTGAARRGWLDLGSIGREQTKTVEEIPDQGPQWVFRFSYGGVDAGRLDVARSELERAGWSVSVPAAVAERLRSAGLPPSAS